MCVRAKELEQLERESRKIERDSLMTPSQSKSNANSPPEPSDDDSESEVNPRVDVGGGMVNPWQMVPAAVAVRASSNSAFMVKCCSFGDDERSRAYHGCRSRRSEDERVSEAKPCRVSLA